MSVIRVGSTGKYAAGWENIFGGSKKKSLQAAGKATKARTSAKPVSVKAAKKDKKKTSARKKR
jgi:hypothetical protein